MGRWQANGLMLLAAVIWGSAFIGQVKGMDGVGPLAFTGLRLDRKSTRLNSSHSQQSRMPSSA